ncbi:DUF262 domain-containing protein [Acidobacteria bacterium AH-259-G07]|nr:DUF262 domain-containing protein [Acidobacteria bacterium AH-259-G07]
MEFESSTQIIGWLRDRYIEGTLEIRPPYQRKPVWAARQKCYLIESVLMGLPVPEIYIQQSVSAGGRTTYAIVDGQQRVRTILQFIGAETDPEEQEYNKFSLDKLPAQSEWRNLTFSDLSEEKQIKFIGYRFTVRFLDTDSEPEVRSMFTRLNKYLTPLNAQELRNATYTGPLIRLVTKLADDEYWAENKIVTAASIRRMGDVEFASNLLIGVLHGPQGGSPKIVDSYYEQYEDYEDEFPGQPAATKLFNETLDIVKTLFADIRNTRWGNKTDFYTLFVGLASLLRTSDLTGRKVREVRGVLQDFANQVDLRLSNERAKVSRSAIDYVRAVEKGANDKRRRADRHNVLVELIQAYFRARKH